MASNTVVKDIQNLPTKTVFKLILVFPPKFKIQNLSTETFFKLILVFPPKFKIQDSWQFSSKFIHLVIDWFIISILVIILPIYPVYPPDNY